MNRYYWRIADGRIWGFAEARWMDEREIPAGYAAQNLHDGGEPSGAEYLKQTVRFYGGRPGELAGLEEALAEARNAIYQRRRKAEYNGFVYDGQRWDSEEKDELRLNSAIKRMELTKAGQRDGLWKISEGAYITLTWDIAVAASGAMDAHYATCFTVEALKKAALAAAGCASSAEVQAWLAENLDAGWPGTEEEHEL